MPTIAIISVGITGRLNASFEIARRLQEWGHTVVIASLDQRARKRVTAEGLAFFQLDAGVPEGLREQARQQKQKRSLGFFGFRSLRARISRARGEAAMQGNGIDGLIARHAPSLLLIESELHDTIIFCQALPVRAALLEYHVSTLRMPAVPPLSSTLTPAAPLFRLRAAAAWTWNQLKRKARHAYRHWYLKGWNEHGVWQRIAAEHGVSLDAIATAREWPLLQYPGLPCLHLCAAEFDFPHATKDSRTCVGPMVQKQRKTPQGDTDVARCRELLRQLASSGRPIVLCATGSILSLPGFLRKVIRAADGEDYELIVAAGRGSSPAALGTLPANVHAFSFVPQLEVLQMASLFICHGGISSIHEALLARVPMIVYSGGCMDENGNAARVAWHQLGLRGDMKRDDWRAIRNKVRNVQGDAEVPRRVAAMREALLRYEREEALRVAVEQLLPR